MTGRITLALLFIVPAAMAYPWSSAAHQWLLGVSIAAVIILFAWWRGLFVMTIIGRRLAMWLRRSPSPGAHRSSAEYVTVLLRVDPSASTHMPVGLVAGYVDRYGLRCDKVRITSLDVHGARRTWIGLTLGAADNLAALRARSPRIPLRDVAEVAGRRLADQLRETGWDVTMVDAAEVPTGASAKETWRGLRDASGYVAAYRVAIDDRLVETLAAVRDSGPEVWTALEITGTATNPEVAAVCAIRSTDRPGARAPSAGLSPSNGRHGPALNALNPVSVDRLESTPVQFAAVDTLRWPVDSAVAIRT